MQHNPRHGVTYSTANGNTIPRPQRQPHDNPPFNPHSVAITSPNKTPFHNPSNKGTDKQKAYNHAICSTIKDSKCWPVIQTYKNANNTAFKSTHESPNKLSN